MEKLGLADIFWPEEYKVNHVEVWACPQLLARELQSELCRSMGLSRTSDEKIQNELRRSLGSLRNLAKRIQSELSKNVGLPTTTGKRKTK